MQNVWFCHCAHCITMSLCALWPTFCVYCKLWQQSELTIINSLVFCLTRCVGGKIIIIIINMITILICSVASIPSLSSIEQILWLLCNYLPLRRPKLSSSLTTGCHWFFDVPSWPTTNVPRVVSTPWRTWLTYCGNSTTRSSCLSVVLYWRRRLDSHGVTSRRRDVSESAVTEVNASVVDSVGSHFTYEWSSHDTRQIPLQSQRNPQSATYSWRSSRQTTMSCGFLIPSTSMTPSSGLLGSVLYRRIVEDPAQTTYMMLSSTVTPATLSTTYNVAYHAIESSHGG